LTERPKPPVMPVDAKAAASLRRSTGAERAFHYRIAPSAPEIENFPDVVSHRACGGTVSCEAIMPPVEDDGEVEWLGVSPGSSTKRVRI
jgi:hypothetical protein